MDSEISNYAQVYKNIQSIPSVVSAAILPGEQDQLLTVHTNWKSQDFVKNERSCFSRDYVLQKDDFKVLFTGIPYDNSNVHLKAFSKSGKLHALLREQKDALYLEIWDRSQKLKTFEMTDREEHGKICETDPFRCFEFSFDDKYLLYTAEEKRPKTVSFFKEVPQKKETEDGPIRGQEYAHREDWGEMCVGIHHPVLCVFDIQTGKAEVIRTEELGEVSIGRATWGFNSEIIFFTAWDESPYRLGVWACRNRRSQIYSYNLETKEIDRITGDNNICVKSLRFSSDGNSLVYLENSSGGPHFKGAKLMKYDSKSKKITTLVDLVDKATGDDFPGIYTDSLPTRCWSSNGKYVIFTTIWRSRTAIVCVDTENGKVQKLNIGEEFGSAVVLDVCCNTIVAEVSAPNIEPCLVIGTFNANQCQVIDWKFLDSKAPVKHSDISWNITKLQPKVPNLKYTHLDYEIILIHPTEKKKSPLIIMPHGGPHSCYVAGFPFRSIGYVKLGYTYCLINFRGSVGFGEDSVNSLPGNVGIQDVEDVHNATLHIKDNEKFDVGDIFIIGGSHGGFLGAHLIGQFPDFYKAASLLNPVTDISAMAGVTDIPDWCWVEGGLGNNLKQDSPFVPNNLQCMWESSPIKYVENVKTPTLLLIGKKDLRVPPSQGYKYYQLLKARNVPVKLFHYEDTHQLLKTPHDGEVFMQTALWFLTNSSTQDN